MADRVARDGVVDSVDAIIPAEIENTNAVEHRLLDSISHNWRGKPSASMQVTVNRIAATRTRKGLIVKAALEQGECETGISGTDERMAGLNFNPQHRWRAELHYHIE